MLNRSVAVSRNVAAYGEEAGAWAVVFHHRLIAFLDKNGNCRADPYWLKGQIMPRVAEVAPETCRLYVAALERHQLVVTYEIDGMQYVHMPGFREHQVGLRHDRESPDVPVPKGFDETAGKMPEGFRKIAGDIPDRIRERAG